MYTELKDNQIQFTIKCIHYIYKIIQDTKFNKLNGIDFNINSSGNINIRKDDNTFIKIFPKDKNCYQVILIEKINGENIKYKLDISPYIPILRIYINFIGTLTEDIIFHSMTRETDFYKSEYKIVISDFYSYIDTLYKNLVKMVK